MKKIKQLLMIALLSNTFALFSQQKVALHSNGVTTIFGGANPFTDAYSAATNGDTLYLPGGNLPYPTAINKGLVIIGAGYHPDSTTTTMPTILSGDLTISQDADKLHLEGFLLTGSISFTTNHKVDSVVIKRCKFTSLTYNGNRTNASVKNEIIECVITGNIDFSNLKTSLMSNCIINGVIANGLDMGISNNLILYNIASALYYHGAFLNFDASFINNNIIFRTYPTVQYQSELNTFTKNIFAVTPLVGSNSFIDNYNDVDFSTLLINQSGTTFDYAHDYHLQNPTSYLGTDGTQVGIYGGMFPFKVGSVPVNPHFQFKNIAPATDVNGDLNIQIQVEAQDN